MPCLCSHKIHEDTYPGSRGSSHARGVDDLGYEIPNRVFVGGLVQETSELELENFFSDYGIVLDVRIVCDRKSGKNKGFGFVTFENERISSDLIEKGSLDYKGHRLRLRKAVRKASGGQFAKASSSESPRSTTQDQLPCYVDNGPQLQLYSYGMPVNNQPVENNMYYYTYMQLPPYTNTYTPVSPAPYIISYY